MLFNYLNVCVFKEDLYNILSINYVMQSQLALIEKLQSPWHMPRILKPSEVLYMVDRYKLFTKINKRFFDAADGRCAIGVLMEYFGGTESVDPELGIWWESSRDASTRIGVPFFDLGRMAIENDNGKSFLESAEYLDALGY